MIGEFYSNHLSVQKSNPLIVIIRGFLLHNKKQKIFTTEDSGCRALSYTEVRKIK
jgi:hypothetical protein